MGLHQVTWLPRIDGKRSKLQVIWAAGQAIENGLLGLQRAPPLMHNEGESQLWTNFVEREHIHVTMGGCSLNNEIYYLSYLPNVHRSNNRSNDTCKFFIIGPSRVLLSLDIGVVRAFDSFTITGIVAKHHIVWHITSIARDYKHCWQVLAGM